MVESNISNIANMDRETPRVDQLFGYPVQEIASAWAEVAVLLSGGRGSSPRRFISLVVAVNLPGGSSPWSARDDIGAAGSSLERLVSGSGLRAAGSSLEGLVSGSGLRAAGSSLEGLRVWSQGSRLLSGGSGLRVWSQGSREDSCPSGV
ncbi:unnamed protein product [Boreogadus saida]